MPNTLPSEQQTLTVTHFNDLVNTPFQGSINAVCWKRTLQGDFSEIVNSFSLDGNMMEISPDELRELELTEQGNLAREMLLADLQLLEEYGASPILNLIQNYERDDSLSFFPTDVYSFHVDRSPIATYTFLCTYHGESSEIVPNTQATQKILIPEVRAKLRELFVGKDADFESFLTEYFFDLHYEAKPDAQLIRLGLGNMWRLAVDHPNNPVLPCLHRAPNETDGQKRLLLIC
jgi:hypothetical protein